MGCWTEIASMIANDHGLTLKLILQFVFKKHGWNVIGLDYWQVTVAP